MAVDFKFFPKIVYKGDKVKARERWRWGVREYHVLLALMATSPTGIKQDQRKVVFSDGTIIIAKKYFNEGFVSIYVPSVSVVSYGKGFKTQRYVIAIRIAEGGFEKGILWDIQNEEYYYPPGIERTTSYPCLWSELEDFVDEYKFELDGPGIEEERIIEPIYGSAVTEGRGDFPEEDKPEITGGDFSHWTQCGSPPQNSLGVYNDTVQQGSVTSDVTSGTGITYTDEFEIDSIKTEQLDSEGGYANYVVSESWTEVLKLHKSRPAESTPSSKYMEILINGALGEYAGTRVQVTRTYSGHKDHDAESFGDGSCPEFFVGCIETGSGNSNVSYRINYPQGFFDSIPSEGFVSSSYYPTCDLTLYGTTLDQEYTEYSGNSIVTVGGATKQVMYQINVVQLVTRNRHKYLAWDSEFPPVSHYEEDITNRNHHIYCSSFYNIYNDVEATEHDPREQTPRRSMFDNVLESFFASMVDDNDIINSWSHYLLDVTGEFDI